MRPLHPGLVIALCITWGQPGCYVLGALVTLTGIAARLAVRWADHHRTDTDVPVPPGGARWAPAGCSIMLTLFPLT